MANVDLINPEEDQALGERDRNLESFLLTSADCFIGEAATLDFRFRQAVGKA